MKLIDLTCPKCNSQMKANSELMEVTCNYCGNKMLLDNETKEHKLTGGFEFGYEQEMGRLKAQRDYEEQQELEREKRAERADARNRQSIENERQKRIKQSIELEKERLFKRCKIINWILLVIAVLVVYAVVQESELGIAGNFIQFVMGILYSVYSGVVLYLLPRNDRYNSLYKLGIVILSITVIAMAIVPGELLFFVPEIFNVLGMRRLMQLRYDKR